MVLNDPALWEDEGETTPPHQWQAVEADERFWFLNASGNNDGDLNYIGAQDLPSSVVVEWEIVTASGFEDYPVVIWSSNDNPGGSVVLGSGGTGSGSFSIPLPTPTQSLTIAPGLYPNFGVYDTVLALRFADAPDPVVPPLCDEMGRATRAYVSAHDRARVHQARLYRFEKRCLIANFNGAIPPARTIASATWRTDSPDIGVISSPQISEAGREAMVMFAAQLGGWANLRCEVTLDNGEVYNQVFRVQVREASSFFDDPPTQAGPFSVTVTSDG